MRKTILSALVIGASVFTVSAFAQANLGGAARVGAGAHVGATAPSAMHTVGQATAQTEQTLRNMGAILEAAGTSLANVVKTTVFLKNMGDFAAMNAIYAKYLAPEGVVPPARSTVAVAALPKDALVEVEIVARA